MFSNKRGFARETCQNGGGTGAPLSAIALIAILAVASAVAQTAAQRDIPALRAMAETQGQRDAVPPVHHALSPANAPGQVTKPTQEAVKAEGRRDPRANSLIPGSLPQDLSPWGMFYNAVPTVKIVMAGLAVASVVHVDGDARKND
jgi:biopolymer transport protein ExbB